MRNKNFLDTFRKFSAELFGLQPELAESKSESEEVNRTAMLTACQIDTDTTRADGG
jgi:hypothetical protein